MDAKQTGSFIASLRRERGLTQGELAQELNVTNKAVSRWETGSGFPDVDSMLALSGFFSVSINELLAGERIELTERTDDETAEDAQKKAEAQIACDSLDLSIKKRRVSRAAVALAAVLAAVAALGAILLIIGRKDKTPEERQIDNWRWFSPYQCSPQGLSPAKVIDVATGEVHVACPDPLCSHSASSETCFFNYSFDKTTVRGSQYADGHIFFVAEKGSTDGTNMKLYDYDMDGSRIEEVYTFMYPLNTLQLYTNGRQVFFTAVTEGSVEDDTAMIGLFEYDPDKKTVSLLDGDARYALYPTDVVFFEDYYIHSDGTNAETDRVRYCKRSYDGSDEEFFETLPDGTPCEIFGWLLKSSGVFANTYGSGGVYFPDGVKVMFPTESATTKPVRYKDSVYYTTRSSEVVELGKASAAGRKVQGYAYDNEIYVLNKDGSYKHYTVDCEYHFIIEAAYENVIIGRIEYRLKENGVCNQDVGADFIRLDLETGEAMLYETSRRSGFVSKTFVCNITLNDN